MWVTLDAAIKLATRHGCPRAEVVAAIRSGHLPVDRPGPRGAAMISHRDLEEWSSRRTRRAFLPLIPLPAGPQTPDRAGTGSRSTRVGDALRRVRLPSRPISLDPKLLRLGRALALLRLRAACATAVALHRAEPCWPQAPQGSAAAARQALPGAVSGGEGVGAARARRPSDQESLTATGAHRRLLLCPPLGRAVQRGDHLQPLELRDALGHGVSLGSQCDIGTAPSPLPATERTAPRSAASPGMMWR